MKDLNSEAFVFDRFADRLGKRLILKVKDLMHDDEYPKLSPDTQWTDVVCALTQGGFGAVVVVDDRGLLLGIITDSDLRRWVMKVHASYLYCLAAKDIMTIHPVIVTAETLAYDALKLIERESPTSILPVVDKDFKSIGLICLHDIFGSVFL